MLRTALGYFAFSMIMLWGCSASPPSTTTVNFTVQCKDGSVLTQVKLTAGSSNVPVNRLPGDGDNQHFGKFQVGLASATDRFVLEAGCGRKSDDASNPDYSTPKTVHALNTRSWNDNQDFVCQAEPEKLGTCELAKPTIMIRPECPQGALVTNVFVEPGVNSAGSATPAGDGYEFTLATPSTFYKAQITCKLNTQEWVARSVGTTIGDARFTCTRPQVPGGSEAYCLRAVPTG